MPGQNPDTNRQDRRSGGRAPETGPARDEGASAVGRENPGESALDADEALGNRTGGYGGNPPSTGPEGAGGRP